MLSAYEILFNVWIKSGEAKVLYRVGGNYMSVVFAVILVMESVVVVEENCADALDDNQYRPRFD